MSGRGPAACATEAALAAPARRRSGPARRSPAESLRHRGLGHVEFFDLAPAELENLGALLDRFAAEGRTSFSFHAPIVRSAAFPHPGVACFFLCEDTRKRERSFAELRRTLEAARFWGAAYVVTHLTFARTDAADPALAARLARDACGRIATMSAVIGVPVDIEFAAYSDGFHRPDDFVRAVRDHPELGLCIDVGHAFLGAGMRRRDYLDDIAALAPYARSLHLWNTVGPEHTRRHHHTPLHPSQTPADGWVDIERCLETVIARSPSVSIVFEYPVETVTEEIQAGYDWVAEIIGRRPTDGQAP